MSAASDHRLPDDVTPDRYDLALAPDLEAATFTGSVDIAVTVHQAVRQVTMNAAELTIADAWAELPAGGRADASVVLDAERERLVLEFDEALPTGTLVLHLDFAGVLNDKLRGFYRSTFSDDAGDEHTIAVTQFEPTDARRAFPCWDEPAHKAVFAVSLEVADDLVALSNGRELRREPGDGGRVRVLFADTMPMSTYLVAFVVGPLEISATTDVDGVPLRIVHRPGQGHLADFAAEIGAFSLRYFADCYGIAYPGDKLDMIAVPDFAFGAMENLGCVIYRETALLVDPASATQPELQAVADTVAHELAHMWFGDLVTMEWWNGIWLNEAFATFMEMKTADAFRPEWNRWQFFGRERSAAFDTDALAATRAIEFPVHSPDDAEAMFDVLTYQKGSAIVRMLEQYLGEDTFRDGIRHYLSTHQFGNTETGDLWDALEATSGEPVRDLMDRWIFQPGHPLVRVTRDDGGVRLVQEQFRYQRDDPGDGSWPVPVVVRAGHRTERRIVEDPVHVDLETNSSGAVLANGGGHGFFRTAYDDAGYAAVLDEFAHFDPLERYSVVDDQLALLLRGDTDAERALQLVARLAETGENDTYVWQQALSLLDTIWRAGGEARPRVDDWRRHTLAPVLAGIGLSVSDADGPLRRELRGSLLAHLCDAGDDAARATLTTAFERAIEDDPELDPAVGAAAIRSIARHADEAQFDALVDRFANGPTPQTQLRALYATARVEDADLFDRYLSLAATDRVRSQNLAFAVRAALSNPVHGERAWEWVIEHWPQLEERLPFNSWHRLLEGITTVTERRLATTIDAELAARPIPQAAQLIDQHRERMWVTVDLAERLAPELATVLA